MSPATVGDAQIVMDVVNTAYKVTIGSQGIAFKREPR